MADEPKKKWIKADRAKPDDKAKDTPRGSAKEEQEVPGKKRVDLYDHPRSRKSRDG